MAVFKHQYFTDITVIFYFNVLTIFTIHQWFLLILFVLHLWFGCNWRL